MHFCARCSILSYTRCKSELTQLSCIRDLRPRWSTRRRAGCSCAILYYAHLKQTFPNLKHKHTHAHTHKHTRARGFPIKTAVRKCLGKRCIFFVITIRNIQKQSIKNVTKLRYLGMSQTNQDCKLEDIQGSLNSQNAC